MGGEVVALERPQRAVGGERRERHGHPGHVEILGVHGAEYPRTTQVEDGQEGGAPALGRRQGDEAEIAGKDSRKSADQHAEVLESEPAQLPAREKIQRARQMLIEGGDAQGIDRAVESEFGLPDKYWENTFPPLQAKVGEHVGVPQRVACADLAVGGKRVKQPRSDE